MTPWWAGAAMYAWARAFFFYLDGDPSAEAYMDYALEIGMRYYTAGIA